MQHETTLVRPVARENTVSQSARVESTNVILECLIDYMQSMSPQFRDIS